MWLNVSNIVQHPLYVSSFYSWSNRDKDLDRSFWIFSPWFFLSFTIYMQLDWESVYLNVFQGGGKLKFIDVKVSSCVIIFEGTQTKRRYVVYYISNIIRNTPPCPPSVSTILTTVNICKSSSCVSIVLFSIHPLFQVAGSECKNLS